MHKYGRFLFVEDEEDTCTLVRSILRGYEIIWTPTASDALQLLKKDKGFDLFLVDYFLPDATGLELCRAIRNLPVNTPIVLVTASRTISIDCVRDARGNGLVRKGEPTFVDHLRELVDDLLPPLALAV